MDHKNPFDSISFLEETLKRIEDVTMTEGLKKVLEDIVLYRNKDLDFMEIGDHLYDGIYISDGEGKTLYINRAFSRITGITADEVVGRNVQDIVEEGKLYENPVTLEVLKQKKRVNSVAVSLKNGKKMLITGSPVFDEQGNIKKVVMNNREMTDLLEIREELEASRQKLKSVQKHEEKTRQEVEHLRRLQFKQYNIIGNSQEMKNIMDMIKQVGNVDVTVLITGETGVGKELVANEIYTHSNRREGPFIKINCAAIPVNLLESELFGYEKGAFTGANPFGKAGMFELANKGTLLLDEIGEMSMELQSKLLRVIQDKEITRVGGIKPIPLDVRILAATNKDLAQQVKSKKFREDLYYRLNVIPLYIPPLRSRKEDIEPLTHHFMEIFNKKYNKKIMVEPSHMDLLKRYSWPGNIRELQNIIERIVVITKSHGKINENQLAHMLNINPYGMEELMGQPLGLKEIVEQIERQTIQKALEEYKSTRKAALILGIDQSTIVKKAKKLGIKIG